MEQAKKSWVTIVLALVSILGSTHVLGLWEASWTREDDYITRYTTEVINHSLTKDQVSDLKAALANLSGEVIAVPFPLWVKDINSNIIYLNRRYETEILSGMPGVFKRDIIGTKGEAMIGVNITEIVENDQMVIRREHPVKYVEWVGKRCGISHKFPWRKNGEVIGTIGVWVENAELPETCD